MRSLDIAKTMILDLENLIKDTQGEIDRRDSAGLDTSAQSFRMKLLGDEKNQYEKYIDLMSHEEGS